MLRFIVSYTAYMIAVILGICVISYRVKVSHPTHAQIKDRPIIKFEEPKPLVFKEVVRPSEKPTMLINTSTIPTAIPKVGESYRGDYPLSLNIRRYEGTLVHHAEDLSVQEIIEISKSTHGNTEFLFEDSPESALTIKEVIRKLEQSIGAHFEISHSESDYNIEEE